MIVVSALCDVYIFVVHFLAFPTFGEFMVVIVIVVIVVGVTTLEVLMPRMDRAKVEEYCYFLNVNCRLVLNTAKCILTT